MTSSIALTKPNGKVTEQRGSGLGELSQSALKTIASLLAWLGVLIGVLSAVSAFNRILDIGLEGFFADCIGFYRETMSPLYDALKRIPFPFTLPDVALDFAALYFVLFSMALRASIIPLSNKDYFQDERSKDADYWTLHQARLEEPYETNLIYASQNPDGTYTKRLYQLRAPWITVVRSLLLALILWPVVTLAPARNLVLGKYLFRSDGKDVGELVKFDDAMVSKRHLRLTKFKALLAAQIVLLPVGVMLFYILAKFSPLGAAQ